MPASFVAAIISGVMRAKNMTEVYNWVKENPNFIAKPYIAHTYEALGLRMQECSPFQFSVLFLHSLFRLG